MNLERLSYAVPLRLRSLFRRQRVERELDDELSYHVECDIQHRVAGGLTPARARADALRALGGIERRKEQCRDARGLRLLDEAVQDVRYGLRSLWQSRGFAGVAVLTLALGLGAATPVFTLVHGVLFTPLPFQEPHRLVQFELGIGPDRFGISPGQYITIEHQSGRLSRVGAFYVEEMTLTDEGPPARIRVGRMTASFLPVLGVTPTLGHAVAEAGLGSALGGGYVLDYRTWVRRFGANPQVLGQTLTLDGLVAPVIGVLPEGFSPPRDLLSPGDVDIWAPLVLNRIDLNWGNHYLTAVGRLVPGADVTQAQAEADLLLAGIGRARPAYFPDNVDVSLTVEPVLDRLTGTVRPVLLLLLGAAGLMLLTTTATVSGMLLIRGQSRRRELAVRAALGAGRWRVARQLLTEGVLLITVGAALGLAATAILIELLPRLAPTDFPRLDDIGLSRWTWAFTGVVAGLTALVFGAVSAAAVLNRDVYPWLRAGLLGSGAHRGSRGRQLLVTVQITLTVMLVVAAGLLLRSFDQMLRIDPGFDQHHLLTLRLAPPTESPGADSDDRFPDRLVRQLEQLPSVTGVAAANMAPLADHPGDTVFDIEARPPARLSGARDSALYQHATQRLVTPSYFEVLGVPILRGRGFRRSDRRDAPGVVIINQRLAERFWPGSDPVGQRMRMHWTAEQSGPWLEIVGVAGNAKQLSVRDEFDTEMLHPLAQAGPNTGATSRERLMVLIRTREHPLALVEPVRDAVSALDPGVPVYDIRTMEQRVSASIAQPRLTLILVGAFSLVALGLAAIGIYGVVAHTVGQRTTELAIRMACGAGTRSLVALVLGRAWVSGVVGMAAGIAGAIACARLFRDRLYGVDPTDPLAIGAVIVTVSGAVLVASYLPARRVSAVDPVATLRA